MESIAILIGGFLVGVAVGVAVGRFVRGLQDNSPDIIVVSYPPPRRRLGD